MFSLEDVQHINQFLKIIVGFNSWPMNFNQTMAMSLRVPFSNFSLFSLTGKKHGAKNEVRSSFISPLVLSEYKKIQVHPPCVHPDH